MSKVEWKKLGDVCSLKARIGWQGLTQKEHKKTGDYLLVTGTDFTSNHQVDFGHCVYVDENRYTQDPNIQLRPNDVLITKDGTLGKMAIIENLPKPATLNGGLFVIRDISGKIHQKFLLHYMLSSKFQSIIESNHTNGTIKHLTQALLTNFPFPIPSLEEQQRIVTILDTFTSSIENLKEQIAQRRKQYEYYRDQLLDLEGKDGVEMKTLGEIAKYRRGSFPQPYGNREWYDGKGAMPFVQVADVEEYGRKLKERTKQYISTLAMPKSVYAPKGTVIVTLQGSIGKVAITQYDSYIDRTLGIFEGYRIDIDKIYFALQLEKIFSIKKEKARGGTIKTITKEEFTNFLIPVPSLVRQKLIVDILDKFEASIQNLEEQLKEREKQYEYYRNKLLTFE